MQAMVSMLLQLLVILLLISHNGPLNPALHWQPVTPNEYVHCPPFMQAGAAAVPQGFTSALLQVAPKQGFPLHCVVLQSQMAAPRLTEQTPPFWQ
jgi:hypothetical protein